MTTEADGWDGPDDVDVVGFDDAELFGPDPAATTGPDNGAGQAARSRPARTNTRLSANGAGAAQASGIWDFTVLTGPARDAAMSTLSEWVSEVLDGWYALVGEDQASGTEYRRLRVPACWQEHRDVVVELGWLAQEWLRAYRDGDGDLHAAAEWHSRYLPGVVERIRRTSTACACSYEHRTLAPGNAGSAG